MRILICLLLISITCGSFGQVGDTSSYHVLEPVTVTAFKEEPTNKTSLNIAVLKIDSLNRYGNYNLTDLLARTPGVSMLSTGAAIAKPVIRGLYGNRVVILISGLKFDNQQWQEEHGLGLSDIGLSKVELIKGPMSVLYGTEAIGGIINLVEEEKPKSGTSESEIGMRFNSNTLGGLLQAGYKENNGNKWFRVRVGAENNADYADGNGNRILNSRFDGYTAKITSGFIKGNWKCTNNFMSTFNRYGFIFNDIYTFITPDERWSRKLNVNPAHLVLLNIASSENRFTLKNKSNLFFNIGIQSNERMENEGGGAISLNMHLLTVQYLLKWEQRVSAKSRLILSNLGSFEDNTNFGARKIVPDANMQESNISAYLETELNEKVILENGAGIGEKWIRTYFTASVNGPEKDIQPFSKFAPYYNAFIGITINPGKAFNLKANIATGVRIANLAELSSNGLHEGVFTYEIGNPNLKNEQNLSLNLLANYTTARVELSLTPFYNYFNNYIYLTPTNEDWFGFPVYRYKQQNAAQYGSEATMLFRPIDQLQLSAAYSGMISRTADGDYTPYIPAQKMATRVSYQIKNPGKPAYSIFAAADYYMAQNNTARYEVSTPQYALLNAGISTDINVASKSISISLTANNLLDRAYYDHLSRFKYFGLLNMGRNFALNVKIRFTR
jgi:iron complex outermembrane recepter protein